MSKKKEMRILALSLGGNLALLVGLCLALVIPRQKAGDPRAEARLALLADPELRQEVVAELAGDALGIHDSHTDAEVGRVLFAGVDQVSLRGERIVSNYFGMRERAYKLPKPEGLVRIVILGDSLVFGHKAQAEDRLGAQLERILQRELGPDAAAVEVLNLGISGWNLGNECAFLGRQLGLLQPDLVVHVMTDNDLDDALGVRGVGAMSTFSPARRMRGEARVSRTQLVPSVSRTFSNPLLLGLDHESRERRAEAQAKVANLAQRLTEIECAYVPLIYARSEPSLLRDAYLPLDYRAGALCVLPAFAFDRGNHVSDTDAHWGPVGAQRLAAALYGWMRSTGAVGKLKLGELSDPAARFAEVFALGDSLAAVDPLSRLGRFKGLDSEFLVPKLDEGEASHIYAGVSSSGILMPFASLVLAPARAGSSRALLLEGEGLGRFELRGLELRVWVEGIPVGSLRLPVDGPVRERFELPADLGDRALLNIQLEASDHILYGAFLQASGVMTLTRLALVE